MTEQQTNQYADALLAVPRIVDLMIKMVDDFATDQRLGLVLIAESRREHIHSVLDALLDTIAEVGYLEVLATKEAGESGEL